MDKEKQVISNLIGSRRIVADLKDVAESKRRRAKACYRIMERKTNPIDKAYWAAKGNAEIDLADELSVIIDKYRII